MYVGFFMGVFFNYEPFGAVNS